MASVSAPSVTRPGALLRKAQISFPSRFPVPAQSANRAPYIKLGRASAVPHRSAAAAVRLCRDGPDRAKCGNVTITSSVVAEISFGRPLRGRSSGMSAMPLLARLFCHRSTVGPDVECFRPSPGSPSLPRRPERFLYARTIPRGVVRCSPIVFNSRRSASLTNNAGAGIQSITNVGAVPAKGNVSSPAARAKKVDCQGCVVSIQGTGPQFPDGFSM